jgi:RND family efflux transporter MFP subunit
MRLHVIGLCLSCSFVSSFMACDVEPAPKPIAPAIEAEPHVLLATPARSPDAPMIGVLVPRAEVVLVASGFARLERLDLEVGDHVGEGDVIAEMDVRGDRSELAVTTAAWKASSAELERLELELEQAKAKREDVEQLEDYVSKAELREQRYAEKLADARKRSAGASLSQQRSKMEEASARIAEAELRAPFAGLVADRYVDAGATLDTGDPVVRLISDARVVRFAVPESNSGPLQLGAEVIIVFPELGEIIGEVATIAPEIQVGTGLIFAEAELTRVADLRVGTAARVRFSNH